MSNTFFTADTHFLHKNVIRYCERPFSSVEEMDETLISNWNAKVKPGDSVYHVGDFGFGNCNSISERLNGKIYLVPGGHDKGHYKNITYVEPLKTIKIDNQIVVLCHYCLRTWDRSHYNSWALFGHSHGKLPPIGKSWDVGVDGNDYSPLSWDEIVEIMKTRPDNPNLIKREIVKPEQNPYEDNKGIVVSSEITDWQKWEINRDENE
jgi:calcineurin-like phosphoesterase family protein